MKVTEKVIQNLKLKVKPSVGKQSTKHVKNSEKHFEKDINLVQEEQFSHKKRSKWESEIYNFSERRNGYDAKAKLQKDRCRYCAEYSHLTHDCGFHGPVTCRKCSSEGHKQKYCWEYSRQEARQEGPNKQVENTTNFISYIDVNFYLDIRYFCTFLKDLNNVCNFCSYNELVDLRKKNNVNNLIISHLNINSIRYKFDTIYEMLSSNLIDVFGVSETKLDDSFKDALFSVEGFKLYRKDNRSSSGGILVLIRVDIIHVRRKDLENIVSSGSGEVLILECKLRSDKWIIANVYRNPKLLIKNS